MRIVILGYIVRGPLGGASWHFMQYVLGLHKMGHDVLFLEDSDNYKSCYNPDTYETSIDPSYGLRFIDKLFKKHQLGKKWAFYNEHTHQWFGMRETSVKKFCQSADIVLNIANINPLRDWWMDIPVRILLDTDPAFTQIRHIKEKKYKRIADCHTHFYSFGENFGKKNCSMPDDGFKWKPTRQPVVLDLWKIQPPNPEGRWTTVMLWDSYHKRRFNGVSFGMKSTSFQDYFCFPKFVDGRLELAIGSETAPKSKLIRSGWHLSDSSTIARTPESFQRYISDSRGEWSIAKHGYVITNSGWFSERSTGYLATGRPVVVQDTGFSEIIECGKGLLSFNSPEEAAEGIRRVNKDYSYHCKHARKTVENYFDNRKVLSEMFDRL